MHNILIHTIFIHVHSQYLSYIYLNSTLNLRPTLSTTIMHMGAHVSLMLGLWHINNSLCFNGET